MITLAEFQQNYLATGNLVYEIISHYQKVSKVESEDSKLFILYPVIGTTPIIVVVETDCYLLENLLLKVKPLQQLNLSVSEYSNITK